FADAGVPIEALRSRAFNLRWAELPEGTIPLTAADPDFAAAPAIREALLREVSQGVFSYGPAGGLPAFRESVARYLRERRGAPVQADGVIAVNSAAAGLAMIARHWLRPTDEAIVLDPVDFLFAHTVRSAGGVPVSWRVDRRSPLDLDRLASLCTNRTRMLCLCNPHNPVGRCFTREELTALGRFCLERGMRLLSDEIWSEITYPPATFTSALALEPEIAANAAVVHGFSKSFGLAGLRIGYVAFRDPAERQAVLQASEHPSTVDGAATLSQVAAAAAYDHALPWLDGFVRHLQARRDQCVDGLRRVPGVSVEVPDANYVAFARVGAPALRDGETIEAFVERLRRDHGVAVVPGSPRWFGQGAAGHVRLCFAPSAGLLAEGLRRFAAGCGA
ncbi:MAG: pyridoxal phosphate-dependent aminotransferase, partial [Planctomycetota bacterium]